MNDDFPFANPAFPFWFQGLAVYHQGRIIVIFPAAPGEAARGVRTARSVIGRSRQPLGKAGVVFEPRRRERYGRGKVGLGQTLSLERHPHRGIAETAGIAGGNHDIANMDVVAVRLRQHCDDDLAGLGNRRRRLRMPGQFLQQGQRA